MLLHGVLCIGESFLGGVGELRGLLLAITLGPEYSVSCGVDGGLCGLVALGNGGVLDVGQRGMGGCSDGCYTTL